VLGGIKVQRLRNLICGQPIVCLVYMVAVHMWMCCTASPHSTFAQIRLYLNSWSCNEPFWCAAIPQRDKVLRVGVTLLPVCCHATCSQHPRTWPENHNFVITNYKQDSATFLIYPLKRILRYRRVLCMPVKPEWSGRRRVRSLSTCSRLSA